jgi:DNA repair protein RadC
MNVKLTKTQKIKLQTTVDIYKVMQQILLKENKIDRNKEHFWTIGLDNSNRILYIELISLGGTTYTPAEPMQVFRVGVMKAAVKIILIHNHPSGSLEPSRQDKDLTDRLIQVGKILDIPVFDHLIITEKSYTSFADTGLLDELEENSRYIPNYQRQAEIKREVAKIAVEKRNIQIARYLKGKGLTVAEIAEATGITEAEAKKLKVQKPKPKQ